MVKIISPISIIREPLSYLMIEKWF